ncbi:RNA-dependent RNA polymerase [Pyricularia oryzae ourmia-like virus 3]|uniref:RNA-dependent RNA polymerase n=1 Tax=Pyricularia oryzae ourmia-like virus 3 TaxID=2291942 RepID=A0A3T0ZCQ0_9VIRU|nr:RNA-dependent RNA polymerase [Pyricularia oryzae ourmia-like virus 3]BBF90578.1 RNA-dependent RNA polymerase [Pyricularia oryzae ourmia-like virus 3]
MATTNSNKVNYSSSGRTSKKSRRCRAYQARTIQYMNRAILSVRSIFGDCPPFSFEGGTCQELARAVKAYLSAENFLDPAAQMSFQSIKKGLPASCSCMEHAMLDDLVSRLMSPPLKLPAGYLRFVRRETNRILHKGWDASYENHCLSAAPPLSSCLGKPRSAGGSLSHLENVGQARYLDEVLHGDFPEQEVSALPMVVQSAGKPRPLTKFEGEQFRLKPVHSTLYGALSKKSWLLRGPPTAEKLERAGFRRGKGVLVSGDYKSASDGLSIEVAEAILEIAQKNSVFVPDSIWSLARRSLRPNLWSIDGPEICLATNWEFLGEVTRGQMMGSLLCFPLLCLQNRLAFLWAGFDRRTPCLINGDDILYQTDDQALVDKWFSVLPTVGLEPEVTKTSREEGWGSLNSTLLKWDGETLKVEWTARFGMFVPSEHPGSLGQNYHSFLLGCPTEYRFKAGREWFKWHLSELRSTGLPLPSLGFRGLLSLRLAKLFDLLKLNGGECPRAFDRHLVGLPIDCVTWVPSQEVDTELSSLNSREMAAHKWALGWKPTDVVRSALRWCIDLTLSKRRVGPERAPHALELMYIPDREFLFVVRNLVGDGISRKVIKKSFFEPFAPRAEVALFDSVIADSVVDLNRGQLPAYSLEAGPDETSLSW